MLTKVEVTQEDIDNGKMKSCDFCPVALAVNRVIRPQRDAQVYACIVIIRHEEGQRGGFPSLPLAAQEFIENFDDERDVEPFSFALNIPDWALPEGGASSA